MRLLLVPIDATVWDQPTMKLAREQVYDSSRRITKQLDLRQDRRRFSEACKIIESISINNPCGSIVEIDGSEAHDLIQSITLQSGITVPFLESNQVGSLCEQLPKSIANKINTADNLVIIFSAFCDDFAPPPRYPIVSQTAFKQSVPPYDSNEDLTDLNDARLINTHKRVRWALENGESLGHMPHVLFTKVMRDYVYSDDSSLNDNSNFLRISFRDGSESSQFPVFRLATIEEPKNLTQIHVGLMSGRHFELDEFIDFYMIRNSELSRYKDFTMADQEQFAFNKATEAFTNLMESITKVEISLYHTGLEPIVIGTYRSIVETLLQPDIRGRFSVVPRIFNRKREEYEKFPGWF